MSSLPRDLHNLEIHDLSLQIRSGKLSPVEVTTAMLARVDALDANLHSFARVTPELALKQAGQAEQEIRAGNVRSPLHGIPLAVKDLFDTKGIVTAGGMPIHSQRVPTENATVVQRLQDAGSVMLGKLQMTEGAFAIHHPTIPDPVNPWGAAHWCGASSSGCGVATAARLCYGTVGSDTGGSVRFPSAANNLTGLKTTHGTISSKGAMELAASLDHIGPMARSARDVLLLLAIIGGHDTQRLLDTIDEQRFGNFLKGFRGLRIGMDEAWISAGVDSVIQRAIQQVKVILAQVGGEIKSIKVPDTRATSSNWEHHCGVQTAVAHWATYPGKAAEYGPALARLIDQGRQIKAVDYERIIREATQFARDMDAVFTEVDVVLAPVQPYAAPTYEKLADLASDPETNRRLIQFTAPFNASGHPALSIPVGFTEQGLPVGGQLIGRKYQDDLLCMVGMVLQSHSDWHRQVPPGLA
ncbi:amidase [Burkholderia anthina]|uniref:Amidase n=1 Tax=Burkholderia anthina TaxID=179879 RepID=A0A7T7AKJ0_9BURK|nr:amidase [Burkholderia anthina]MBY4869693.1 amidase [Burkholderia anthina]QQK05913.1 amidase [Burkholderia anthina]